MSSKQEIQIKINNLTSQTEPDSIPPAMVGEIMTDLNNKEFLTEDYIPLNGTSVNRPITNNITGSNYFGSTYTDFTYVQKKYVDEKFYQNGKETKTQLQSPTLDGNVLTLNFKGEDSIIQQVSIDLSSITTEDTYITGFDYNPTTNIVTITNNNLSTFTINLSDLVVANSTDENGITTLSQKGVVKLTVSKVGQSGSYNDLLNKPDLTVYATVEQLNNKLDKPTTDGIWAIQKLGSVFTWVSGVIQNIANTDLSNLSARIFTQGNTFTWNTAGFGYFFKNLIDKSGDSTFDKKLTINSSTGQVAIKDNNDTTQLIFSYTHTSNTVLLPEAVDYSTGYVTVTAHGLSFVGQRIVGLFNRGWNVNSGYSSSSFPNEYVTSTLYIKIIDANTVMICNSSGNVIPCTGTGNFNNWQIEIFSELNAFCNISNYNGLRMVVYSKSHGTGTGSLLTARTLTFYSGMGYTALANFQIPNAGTKQNVSSIIFIELWAKFKFMRFVGGENTRYTLNGNGNFANGVQFLQVTYGDQGFGLDNTVPITRIGSSQSGGGAPAFFCNNSVIEIYKI